MRRKVHSHPQGESALDQIIQHNRRVAASLAQVTTTIGLSSAMGADRLPKSGRSRDALSRFRCNQCLLDVQYLLTVTVWLKKWGKTHLNMGAIFLVYLSLGWQASNRPAAVALVEGCVGVLWPNTRHGVFPCKQRFCFFLFYNFFF